jgi:hypothetical protein
MSVSRHPSVDALVDVVDQLDDALSVLRVAWAGLCCGEEFLASPDDCLNVINIAANRIEDVRNKAQQQAMICVGAGHER